MKNSNNLCLQIVSFFSELLFTFFYMVTLKWRNKVMCFAQMLVQFNPWFALETTNWTSMTGFFFLLSSFGNSWKWDYCRFRFGLKLFALCDSKTHYLLKFTVFHRKGYLSNTNWPISPCRHYSWQKKKLSRHIEEKE